MTRRTTFTKGAVTAAAAAVVLSLFAAGCADSSSAPADQSGVAGEPKSGGTLNYAWSQDDRNVDLAPETALTGDCCIVGPGVIERMALYDALVVLDLEGNLQYRLAESVEGSGASWVLKLRPDMQFSDGTAFDAEAVKSTWERWATDPKVPPTASGYAKMMSKLTVKDATTLAITLAEENNQFPVLLAQTVLGYIPSPTAVEKEGADFGKHPVGAGPFLLKSYQPDFQVSFVRNDKYPLDPPYLDALNIKFLSDPSQRFNTLETGGVEAAFSVDWNDYVTAQSKGLEVELTTVSGGSAFVFNTVSPPFDDVRARRAVLEALDGQSLNDALYGGKAASADALFQEDSPFYQPATFEPDLERAQALVDELGGLHFKISIVGEGNAAQAQWMQARMAELDNASVEIETLSDPEPLITGNFQATLNAAPRFIDPYPQLALAVGTGGGYNFGKYTSAEMDEALKAGQNSADLAARKQAYETVNEIMERDIPRFFFLRIPVQTAYDPAKVGAIPILSDGLPDLARAWMR